MNNFKVYWPGIIAIALAVSVVSCHNEQVIQEHNHNMHIEQMQEAEETFEELRERIHNIKLDKVVIPEELEIETNEEEAGFSK